jgi:hypothetical protein
MHDARGAALALALLLAGCSPMRATPDTRYTGMLLNARGQGAEALATEMRRDSTIRDYVARNPEVDFLVIGSWADVELVYAPISKVAHFHRLAPDAPSAVQEVIPIPTGLLQILPRDLRAGTPRPMKTRACWTIPSPAWSCRTCCATRTSCVTECAHAQEGSTETPRQNAM